MALLVAISAQLPLALAVVPVPVAQAAGTTWYVATTGSDASVGTQVAPFRTIGKAVASASSGDTVSVSAGTYPDMYVTVDKPITIAGARSGVDARARGSDGTDATETILSGTGGFIFRLGASNITLDGLKFSNIGCQGITTNAAANPVTDSITIRNSVFLSTSTNGCSDPAAIAFMGGTGKTANAFTFERNWVANRKGRLLYLLASAADGIVRDNYLNGANFSFGPFGQADGWTVTRNAFDGSIAGLSSALPGATSGTYVGYGFNAQFGSATFTDNTVTGMYLGLGQISIVGGSIIGNTFHDNYAGAFQLWEGEYGSPVSRDVTIANNLVRYNGTDYGSDSAGFLSQGFRVRPDCTAAGPCTDLTLPDASRLSVHHNKFVDLNKSGGKSQVWAIRNTIDASNNAWSRMVGGVETALLTPAAIAARIGKASSDAGSGLGVTSPWIRSYTDDGTKVGLPGFWPTAIVYDQPCTISCHVNASTGDDTQSGSSLAPFRTIQKGVDSVTTGGTVHVAAGTYPEQVYVTKSDITLRGANAGISPGSLGRGPESIIVGQGGGAAVVLGAPGVTLDGFVVRHAASSGTLTGVWISASDGTIRDTAIGSIASGTASARGIRILGDEGIARISISRVAIQDITAATVAGTATGIEVSANGMATAPAVTDLSIVGTTVGRISGAAAYGISVLTTAPNLRVANVELGAIAGPTDGSAGIRFGTGSSAASATIENSSLLTAPAVVAVWTDDDAPRATRDWWGLASGPSVDQTVGSIVTSPWMADFTEDASRLGQPGFWPVDPVYRVTVPRDATTFTVPSPELGTPRIDFPAETTTGITVDIVPIESPLEASGTPFRTSGSPVIIDIELTDEDGRPLTGGPFTVCLDAAPGQRIWHYEEVATGVFAWIDITGRELGAGPITMPAGKVCGRVWGFSPFAASAGKTETATTVTATPATSTYGQTVTFAVDISRTSGDSGPDDITSGQVALYDGTSGAGVLLSDPFCLISSASTADCVVVVTDLTVGTHVITAYFSGTDDFAASEKTLSFVVTSASLAVTVTSEGPSRYGDATTFTTTLAPASGVLDGTVSFFDGTTPIPGCQDLSASTWTVSCTRSDLTAGQHTIAAHYSGGAFYVPSSDETTHTVEKAPTALALLGGGSTTYRDATTFTAVVTAVDGDLDGTVAFSDGTSPIAGCEALEPTGASGTWTATCTTTDLSAGQRPVVATYSGGANYVGSSDGTTHTVAKAWTTVTLAGPGTSTFGSPATFTATISATSGDLNGGGRVSFSDGSRPIPGCTTDATSRSFSCTTADLTAGTHAITVRYSGNANFDETAATIVHTVSRAVPVLTYVGPTYISLTTGTSTVVAFRVSVTPSACTGAITYQYTRWSALTAESTTGATTLEIGLYSIRAASATTGDCEASYDEAALAIVSPGGAASGGGAYMVKDKTAGSGWVGGPRVSFAFTLQKSVKAISKTNPDKVVTYSGQFLWVNKGAWRLKATITSTTYTLPDGTTYTGGDPFPYGRFACPSSFLAALTSPTTGVQPTCGSLGASDGTTTRVTLERWTEAGWVVDDSFGAVSFTASLYDGGQLATCKTTGSGRKLVTTCTFNDRPDMFGIQVDPVPGTRIRESLPIWLSGGSVKVA